MLLVIDVGNTNTVLGVFAAGGAPSGRGCDRTEAARYERLVANWRVGSHLTRTVDEYGVIFRNLFSMDNLEVSGVRRDRDFIGGASARFGVAAGVRALFQHQAAVHRARA